MAPEMLVKSCRSDRSCTGRVIASVARISRQHTRNSLGVTESYNSTVSGIGIRDKEKSIPNWKGRSARLRVLRVLPICNTHSGNDLRLFKIQ